MNIFVIHYKKLTERRTYLENMFQQLKNYTDINVHWFDNIDRDNLAEYKYMYKEDPEKWTSTNNIWHNSRSPSRPLTNGEIACAVTHILVYKYIIDNSIQKALIFEDDVILLNTAEIFVQRMNRVLKELSDDFDMCWLSDFGGWTVENYSMDSVINRPEMHVDPYLASLNKNIIFDDKYIYRMPCNKTTDAYFISNKCAKLLYTEFIPFCLPIDWNHTPAILKYNLKNYWTVEPLVSQGSTGIYKSSNKQDIQNISNTMPQLTFAEIKYYKHLVNTQLKEKSHVV
jgi:GR25 family glycosyltransferase involved in LPS biosynthesis